MDVIANWLVQGCMVALATVLTIRCLPRARAAARYVVCWVGLSAVLVLPLVSLVPVALSQVQGVTVDAPVSPALVSLPHAPTAVPLIIGAWLVWLAVCGVQLATATAALQRARQRCRAFPLALERHLVNWTRVKDDGRTTQLVVSNDVRAAAVIGCVSPVIAVAPALVLHLTAAELDRIVIHEWAHVQRRDDLGNLVQLMVRLAAGWHPGVWLLDRWLRAEREIACDEMAVMLTGSSKVYAACLVKLASLPLTSRETLPALGVLSSGSLATRVQRILSRNDPAAANGSRNSVTLSIGLLIGVSLAVGSLRIVEAVAVLPELDGVVSAQATLAKTASDSAVSMTTTPASITVSRVPRNAPRQQPVTTLGQTLPDDATPADTPNGAASEYPPADVAQTPPATAIHTEARDGETEEIKTTVDVIPPQASPTNEPSQTPNAQPVTPWTAAADAGVSLGQRSKEGGVATARFFSRFGKRIANAF